MVPRKNSTVNINIKNIRFYARIISIYENNDLDIDDEDILINKKICRQYTFQKNYYYVLGDNRHSSKDSRYWGFVPEDYIIGKAGRIFFSIDNDNEKTKIRWKRIFKKIH